MEQDMYRDVETGTVFNKDELGKEVFNIVKKKIIGRALKIGIAPRVFLGFALGETVRAMIHFGWSADFITGLVESNLNSALQNVKTDGPASSDAVAKFRNSAKETEAPRETTIASGYVLLVDSAGKQYRLPEEFLAVDGVGSVVGGDGGDKKIALRPAQLFHIVRTESDPNFEQTYTYGAPPPGEDWCVIDHEDDGKVRWAREVEA